MKLNEGKMLISYIALFSIFVNVVFSYNTRMFTLFSYEDISESQCGLNNNNVSIQDVVKLKVVKDKSGGSGVSLAPGAEGFSFISVATTKATELPKSQATKYLNSVLKVEDRKVESKALAEGEDYLAHWPTGQVMRQTAEPIVKIFGRDIIAWDMEKDTGYFFPDNRYQQGRSRGQKLVSYNKAETFQDKGSVHLPFLEYMHRGHCRLKITKDYMQTAVDAFAIFISGDLADVQRLPGSYVLQSARTIAMMRVAREKLAATWTVVKGSTPTIKVTFETLEKFRPLFKYINGREMARLNLSDNKILSFIGTHPDLNRHQVGVVANKYIQLNPRWTDAKYLNIMNNLLCGVPMIFMRRIPENTYLQLTHQIFYHIRACDPLQRRFYLAMMMRTQALGKSYSWSAREVSRLGLLLAEVSGPDLSAINPEAMSGITAQVMLEMPVHSLKLITETQLRYLDSKPLNIMARKLIADQTQQLAASYPAVRPLGFPVVLLYISFVIILETE